MLKEMKEWGIALTVALICALLINKFVFFIAVVPTGSMIPTVEPSERVIVTKVYNPEYLERGDIVVFKSDELDKVLFKRLIALPGDRVKVVDGVITINGTVQNEPYVIFNDAKTAFDGKEITVPEGEYLFMGDNRASSYDSRYWQNPFINGDKIMGKAQFRVFPFDRIGGLYK